MGIQSKVKILMEAKGFSMKGLSLAAGLNETAVRDIIVGRIKSPKLQTLKKISNILGCSIEELVKDNDKEELISNKMGIPINTIYEKIFTQSIVEIDKLIKENNLKLSSLKKAHLYLEHYTKNLKKI